MRSSTSPQRAIAESGPDQLLDKFSDGKKRSNGFPFRITAFSESAISFVAA